MINKVTLIGRLGNDPESRNMTNGNAVTNISLATTRRWKNKGSGERQEETEWHRLVFFNKVAEIAGKFLRKGSLIYIEGRIKTSKYTDKSGVEKYSTEIIVDQMQMLDTKISETSNQQTPNNNQAPQQNNNDYSDDVPF